MSENLTVVNHDYTLHAPAVQAHPLPRPQPAGCRSARTRVACGRLLADLAWLQDSDSETDKLRYQVGMESLRMLTGYLCVLLDQEDAARR